MLAASLSPNRSSVDSTSLRERKTTHRNGGTLKSALVGRLRRPAGNHPHALESRIAQKANARGNARDTLT